MSYREVSEVRDGMQINWDMPITMDDGVVLRCDIFRPVKKGRYPVILSYGPYGKWLHSDTGIATLCRSSVAASSLFSIVAISPRFGATYRYWSITARPAPDEADPRCGAPPRLSRRSRRTKSARRRPSAIASPIRLNSSKCPLSGSALCHSTAPSLAGQLLEIVDDVRLAVAEHFDALLPHARSSGRARYRSVSRRCRPRSRWSRELSLRRYGSAPGSIAVASIDLHRRRRSANRNTSYMWHASPMLRPPPCGPAPSVERDVAGVQPILDHQRRAAGRDQLLSARAAPARSAG